jgi:group I intron endonuclease
MYNKTYVMKNTTYIYFLHKGDNVPFYIGKSISPKGRIKGHKKRFGLVYLEVIDNIPTDDWLFWEKWYIEVFKSWGFELQNKNKGGGGVSYHSPSTKQKMSKPKPDGFGGETSLRLLGHKQSQETIDKRVSKLKGKKRTHEQKEKLSISFQNRIFSEERNKKISDSQKGKPKPKSPELIASLKKPILQYNKNEEFIREWESATDAALFYGNVTTIQNALKQRRCKTAYGFIWKYKI